MHPVCPTSYALAKSLHVPLPRVNDIAREKRAFLPEMALLLSAYFGTSEGYWLDLQAHFDLEMVKDRVAKQLGARDLSRSLNEFSETLGSGKETRPFPSSADASAMGRRRELQA